MEEITQYVLGFIFDSEMKRVVLVVKKRPEWQAGYLNGVGGKVNEGETFVEAMIRETEEETGAKISEWENFGTMTGPTWEVELFKTTLNDLSGIKTKTDEKIQIRNISDLKTAKVLKNIPWLIGAAKDENIEHINLTYKN